MSFYNEKILSGVHLPRFGFKIDSNERGRAGENLNIFCSFAPGALPPRV